LLQLTERAKQQLVQWASEEQPDVFVRLMMVWEGG
jgi:hypothetical protein